MLCFPQSNNLIEPNNLDGFIQEKLSVFWNHRDHWLTEAQDKMRTFSKDCSIMGSFSLFSGTSSNSSKSTFFLLMTFLRYFCTGLLLLQLQDLIPTPLLLPTGPPGTSKLKKKKTLPYISKQARLGLLPQQWMRRILRES